MPSQASALQTLLPPASHFGLVVPTGSPLTPLHLPGAPPTLHASHCPLHRLSQQTPSTQNPLVHSIAAPHFCPIVFTQVPAAAPAETSAQADPRSHFETVQHTFFAPPASVQCVLLHCVSSVQTVPRSPMVVHTPSLQAYPLAQSAIDVHGGDLHALAPHT